MDLRLDVMQPYNQLLLSRLEMAGLRRLSRLGCLLRGRGKCPCRRRDGGGEAQRPGTWVQSLDVTAREVQAIASQWDYDV